MGGYPSGLPFLVDVWEVNVDFMWNRDASTPCLGPHFDMALLCVLVDSHFEIHGFPMKSIKAGIQEV